MLKQIEKPLMIFFMFQTQNFEIKQYWEKLKHYKTSSKKITRYSFL